MAESVKVRLVRCPKCANLLTELPDFSLYKCGGCGAVLQAKKKAFLKDGLMETPDDTKGIRTSAECNINNMSNVDMESIDGIEVVSVEKYNKERVTSIGNSMSRFGNGEPLADFDANRRGKERVRRLGYHDDEKKSYTQGLVGHGNHDEFSDLNINTTEYGYLQRRFGSFPHHVMGPSSYELNSHYEHIERTRFKDQGLYGFARVEELEHDRVELLRKLDELKGQLNRSWDMDDKPNERMVSPFPPDSYGGLHSAYAREGLNNSHGVNKMILSANELESPYFSRIHGHSPHMGRFDSGMQDSYSPRVFPHEFGGFRPPHQSPYGRMHHQYHEDVRGYYSDASPDRVLHEHRQFLHRSSCSCEHCYNRNSYVPPKIDHFKSLHRPYSHNINHHSNPIRHVSQGYSSGGSPLHSRRSPTLNSADLDYENESLDGHRHRNVDVAQGRRRLCHPILGGAPFITCCNCFELLKLPRKHLSSAKKRKMKCGSCFSVILFELGSKSYAVSLSSHDDPISTNVDVGFNKADINACPNKGEFTDKSNYVKPERQLDPRVAISSIPVNKHNTHASEKSNFDEPEKQLHPLSGNSSILMAKHDMANKPSSEDLEKLTDPTNKLNYDGFGKQVDSLSSSSCSSVGQHYVETSHKSSLDESNKQVDPLSVMSTVSIGSHETDMDKKLNYGESEKQADSHFAALSNSIDEDIPDTNQKYDDESGKMLDTHFTTPHISTDEHKIDDNLNSGKPEKQLNPLSPTNMTSEKHYNLPEEYHVHSSGNNISGQFHVGDQSNQSKLALDQATTSQISANDSARAGASVNSFPKPEKQLNLLSPANMTSEKHYNLPEEYHVHSSGNNISSQFHEGDQSNRSKLALDQATTSQISANDSARAGVSVNAFPKPEMQLNPLSSENVTSEKHYNLPEEYHVHTSGNNVGSQFDERGQSSRSKLALDQATTSQISANDSARAGVSVNAFSNRRISNNSGEISEDDHARVNIKGESFGATENSSNDTSDYDQSLDFNESKVFVNNHFIPNRDVQKAEKLAGPIQPGEYWYDIRAGFWGVMGRPCLGIVMPNIEEFNYPLPEHCAAGNTGVRVNGRELHQKDLDILASRGLPILKYGSYIVDISGKVVDVHTGEELDSLGKLAPTVEREKRGFGMRVP
ncbi:uncharacterized protein [Henckelia pumila]|uniref:uncharacterized protein n=1 Tax=Henckelia pumila TaxID=405737 RepID=UPI003C6DD7CB